MRKIKLVISIIFIWALFILTSSPIHASEGTIELQSAEPKSNCVVNSVLMTDFNYSLLVNCRGLVYPPDFNLFSYVIWATPLTGNNVVKLGELGVGKAEFRTNVAFSNLFVTTEANNDARTPSGRVIMQGSVQPATFQAKPVETAPSPAPKVEKPTPTPTKTATKSSELIAGIRRIAIIFFLTIFGLIILGVALIVTFRRLSG